LVSAVESGASGQVSPVGASTDKRLKRSSDSAGTSPPGPTSVSEVLPKLATAQPGIADQPRAVQEPEVFVSRLRLKPTEVRSLKLDRPIGSALSDDLKVCAVIRTGQSQIQLIATGEGTAKLSVITAGEDGKEDVENYEVIVGDMRTSQVESPEATAATLTQTARSAFPGSEVTVAYRSGRLVVTGSVADEGSARRLLRMIRSACSMPVDDKLMVR
jgi:Flp pilus assembly secretin CpaC